jgi:transcriptional regulator of arginine metabolism
MKLQRQAAILKVVRAQRIASQDELRRSLAREGYRVTQATLSRDVRELKLVKLSDPRGAYYAQPDESGVRPDFQAVLRALLTGVDGVGPLLVLRTANGSAGAVGVAIDQAAWSEIIGTVAGEDTLLVITRSESSRKAVSGRLTRILRAPR